MRNSPSSNNNNNNNTSADGATKLTQKANCCDSALYCIALWRTGVNIMLFVALCSYVPKIIKIW